MVTSVNVPNVGQVNFPDSMSQSDIQGAIASGLGGAAPPTPSAATNTVSALPPQITNPPAPGGQGSATAAIAAAGNPVAQATVASTQQQQQQTPPAPGAPQQAAPPPAAPGQQPNAPVTSSSPGQMGMPQEQGASQIPSVGTTDITNSSPGQMGMPQETKDATAQGAGIFRSFANSAITGIGQFYGGMLNLGGAIGFPMMGGLVPGADGKITTTGQDLAQRLSPLIAAGEQNDEANVSAHPWAVTAGKLASGLAVPGLGSLAKGGLAAVTAVKDLAEPVVGPALAKIAQYATAAGVGVGQAGLLSALNYEPGQTSPINVDAAKAGLTSPLAAGLGAVTMGAIPNYLKNAETYNTSKAAAFGADVRNSDVVGGTYSKAVNSALQNLPVVGDNASRAAQAASFPPAIIKFIQTVAPNFDVSVNGESGAVAAQQAFAAAKNRISTQETALWKPINDVEDQIPLSTTDLTNLKGQVQAVYDNNSTGIPLSVQKILKPIANSDDTSTMSLGDLRDIRSQLGNIIFGKNYDLKSTAGQDVSSLYGTMLNNLTDSFHNSSFGDLQDPYVQANAFTAEKYKTFQAAGPQFQKAMQDQINAASFAKALMREPTSVKADRMLAPFNEDEANTIRAGMVQQHMYNAIDPVTNKFDAGKFVKSVDTAGQTSALGPTYDALQGLIYHMKANTIAARGAATPGILQSKLAVGAAAAAGSTIASGLGGAAAPIAGGLLVGGNLLAAIARNSPLKSALGKIGQYANNPSVASYYYKAAQPTLERARIKFSTDKKQNTNADIPDS